MYAATLPSEPSRRPHPSLSDIRVTGGAALTFAMRGGRTSLTDLREEDGYKVRCPRRPGGMEAVIINTGGGLAGGDHVRLSAGLGEGTSATVTMPAAERVYGALNGATTILDVRLMVGDGAALHWLPQETILFNRARLQRSMTAEIAASAELLIAETVILGRAAMGESVASGLFADRWRIRRGGALVFAENVRLDGGLADLMQRPAIGGGARIVSTILFASSHAENRLAAVRKALEHAPCEAAASAWNGLLVIRALGRNNGAVRQMLERALPLLSQTTLPRSWST